LNGVQISEDGSVVIFVRAPGELQGSSATRAPTRSADGEVA
jgi:hypothetical protein